MQQDLTTLDQLPLGEGAIIRHVGCSGPMARRLMEMGLLPGTRIEAIRRAPLGDPLKIRLRGYLLSLRCSDAAQISLETGTRENTSVSHKSVKDIYQFPPHVIRPTKNDTRVGRVLLAGNANTGKTTIFNALTGSRAQVSNYPGVTVTRITKKIILPDGVPVEIIDLPGTYSLCTNSPDEQVAVDAILGRHSTPPDAVIVVVNASALERSLYLMVQIAETGRPVVIALNMTDEATAAGIDIDAKRLGKWLGATVVPIVASQRKGIDALRTAVSTALRLQPRDEDTWLSLPAETETDVSKVREAIAETITTDSSAVNRSWALWSILSFESDDNTDIDLSHSVHQTVHKIHTQAIDSDRNLNQEIIASRYRWIEAIVSNSRTFIHQDTRKWTDKLDNILTQRVYGLLVFGIVMELLFEALFTWSEPMIGAIEISTAWLQTSTALFLPAGILQSLIIDGVIAGVGNVVVFVPQIAMLFFFIAVLDDVGYLARVAFIIDRLMGRIGLHGKAFVPMLSGFACAIPAVMATRNIENRNDRLITMLTLPMISCSARLPVYALVTAVIFATDERLLGVFSIGAVVLFSMYALSVIATLAAAAVLRRTVLRGPRIPLVLELPPYRVPIWRNVFLVTWQRVRRFLVDAGTIILTMTIILWAFLSFPASEEISSRYDEARYSATTTNSGSPITELTRLNGLEASEQIRYSFGGRFGRAIEPVLEPLGFDWRIGIGLLGAFAAREVFVSTLGIVFGIEEADEETQSLRSSLRNARKEDGSPLMTPLTGISLMVFFVLACQCMSTIVIVRKESGTWRWPIFMFGYMSALAYIASFVIYQTGSILGLGLGVI